MTAEEFDKLKIGDKVYTVYMDIEDNVSVIYGEIQSIASFHTGSLKTYRGTKRITNGSVFHTRTEAVKDAIRYLTIDIRDQKYYIDVAKKRIIKDKKNIKELRNDNRQIRKSEKTS